MTARVALVLVSHSRGLAEGARELAAQMAPEVTLIAAGGDGAGGLGTSFDLVEAAITEAAGDDRSVVVLTDLGSAVLTTESVVEMLDEDVAARVRVPDAPFVEAAVAASVEAAGGGDLAAVLAAAARAGAVFADAPPVADAPADPTPSDEPEVLTAHVVVRNKLGLHARPAALLARSMAGFDASVQVDGVNAASVLELMRLGATQGRELTVSATGPQARVALDAFAAAIEEGFGEL
jgi:phosphoenolpyruvate---glycerone phosphotransferase subunit DhaM